MPDWKSYRRRTRDDDWCSCGDGTDMYVDYAPKVTFAILGGIVAGGAGIGRRHAMFHDAMAYVGVLLGAVFLAAIFVAIYSHIKCRDCRKHVRTENSGHASTLGVIRIGALVGGLLAGAAAYLVFSGLR